MKMPASNSTPDLHPSSTEDLRVRKVSPLVPPREVKSRLPIGEPLMKRVFESRQTIRDILSGRDRRLLAIVGPCSIHDPEAALDYARRLQPLRESLSDRACVVMRVYFEKPRTTIGWKGLINDPEMDDSCNLEQGILTARRLLLEIGSLGLPAATEFLDPVIPQYIGDLVSWAAIGARTTESQTHRELASGLSMPVGFKNATDGNIDIAVDAMLSARNPHSFLGIDQDGITSVVKTAGNPDAHLVMRGGRNGPNYSAECVRAAAASLKSHGLPASILVDCSHANANKEHQKQPAVWANVVAQWQRPDSPVIGAMLESFLHEGNQKYGRKKDLQYGVSVTDRCIAWNTTEHLLKSIPAPE